MIYFAMNHKFRDKGIGATWTAISEAPYLRAIELYAKGDAWEGGGLFTSKNCYWLNDRHFTDDLIMQQSSAVKRVESPQRPEGFGAECRSVYYPRLIRDGWVHLGQVGSAKAGSPSYTIFEKRLPKGWVLRKIAHENCDSPAGSGCYWDQHKLINLSSGLCFEHKDWEWAERDGHSVVWASKGCLYRAQITSAKRIEEAKLLHDFTPYTFKTIKAPYDDTSKRTFD